MSFSKGLKQIWVFWRVLLAILWLFGSKNQVGGLLLEQNWA